MILRYVWSIRVEKGRYIEQERAQCLETEERDLVKPDGGSYAITQPPFLFFPRVASRLGGDTVENEYYRGERFSDVRLTDSPDRFVKYVFETFLSKSRALEIFDRLDIFGH
jgi:hypothetical protein